MKPIPSFPAFLARSARTCVFAALAWASAAPVRAEYYNFNTQAGSDILYQEIRYPYWAQSTYNARYYNNVEDASGHSVFFYSGTTYSSSVAAGSTGNRNNGYIWSFWPVSNPVNSGDSVTPLWWNPPFYDVPSIGEGASGKVEASDSRPMTTGVWYPSVMRVWRPTGNPADTGRVGQWLKDGVTGEWTHIATMHVPFAATHFNGTLSGFLEDFSNGNTNPRRADFRNIYYRKGSWQAATTFRPSTRQSTEKGTSGLIEGGTVGFFETCSGTTYTGNMGPGAQEISYTLNTPPVPTFDPLVVNDVAADVSGGQIRVKWSVPATSAPQFAYKVEVFPSSDVSGTPAVTTAKIDPDVNECLVSSGGIGSPTVRLTITDVFDRDSTPAVVAAATAVLTDAVTPSGTVPGLNYKYYETSVSSLPDFSTLAGSTLKLQGAVNRPDLTVRKKHTSYLCRYQGYLEIPADGLWLFSLASCDGSRLIVDGVTVIDNNGVHSGGSEKAAAAGLRAGRHLVDLQYFKNSSSSGDNDQLRLSWEGPGVAKAIIPENVWFRTPAAGEPTVALTSPAAGATLSASGAPLTATVNANGNALNSVRFFNKETVWATRSGTTSPFSTTAQLGAGANHLKARLVYGAGSAFTLDSPSVDVTAVQPALAPWNFSPIGLHAFQSSGGFTGGTWSLTGDGMNVAWQEISGDETIIARVAGKPSTGTGNSSQFDAVGFDSSWNGGVIFRENLSPSPGTELGSRFVALYKETGNATRLQSSDDQNAGGPVVGANLGSSYTWMKLQRAGALFTASLSTDGNTWTQVGTRTMGTPFGQKMYVGVFTLARPSTNPNPHWWKFDNVSLASVTSGFRIGSQPSSKSAYAGGVVTFSVTAVSNTPLTYQWQKGGTDIPGATGAALTLDPVQATDAGAYRVVLSNGADSVTSDPATLTVRTPGTGYQRSVEIKGPVAYWRLNETAGPTAVDHVGGYNGTFMGGLTAAQAGPRPAAFPAFEATNNAIKGNGSNSRIEVPALNLNSNTVTITGWVKRSGNTASYAGIVYSRSGATVAGLHFGGANELRYSWNDAGNTWGWNSNLVPPDGQWTFVALVVEPTKATIYMNPGTGMVSATNGVSHAIEEFNGTLCLGQDSGSRVFNGTFDEIAIFDRSLSAAEIAEIYAAAPALTVAATTPTAFEFGTVPGVFTITRTGPTTAALPVNFSITGTATEGTDYAVTGTTATIPAGASATTVTVTPIADSLIEGPETVVLTLAPGAGYSPGSPNRATVTLADKPADAWRLAKFGTDAGDPDKAGDSADPDHDGMSNLLEYGLNTNPNLPDAQAPVMAVEGANVTLTYRRNLAATDLSYEVQESTDLVHWAPATVTQQTISDDDVTRVIKASASSGGAPEKFLRLKITCQ